VLLPELQAHDAAIQAEGWRRVYIEPDHQTEEDIVFLLALVLLQEGMVPDADVEPIRAALAESLSRRLRGDLGTAYLVLNSLERHFTEPQDWLGLQYYIKQLVFRTEHQQTWRRVFTPRRDTAAADTNAITVDDALARYKAESLPAARSTLFRRVQAWALKNPLLAGRDEHGNLWLTREGFAEARNQLVLKAVTQLQVTMGKEKDAARKFTQRHKLYIQEAVRRGETPKAIAEALGIGRPPHQRGSHP
jgi:hypothetical protein